MLPVARARLYPESKDLALIFEVRSRKSMTRCFTIILLDHIVAVFDDTALDTSQHLEAFAVYALVQRPP